MRRNCENVFTLPKNGELEKRRNVPGNIPLENEGPHGREGRHQNALETARFPAAGGFAKAVRFPVKIRAGGPVRRLTSAGSY